MIPPTLDHFHGQPDVVARLRVALEAAWNDGTCLPHMLLTGPPGVGKTTIAQIAAREMGSTIHDRIGQVLVGSGTVNCLLMQPSDKDIVFIDEAHEMPRSSQTLLYRAMEDGQVFIRTDSDKTLSMPIQSFTLVLATTDEYALLQPLRDRCKVVLPFGFYETEALAYIVKQRAQMMKCSVTDKVTHEIAQRSRGTPRLAIRLLEACYRMARSVAHDCIDMQHFQQTMAMEHIDSLGLGKDEQAVLSLLAQQPGEAMQLSTLASILGVHHRTIQMVVEPYLIREGLIERGNNGRMITMRGLKHFSKTSKERKLLMEGEVNRE